MKVIVFVATLAVLVASAKGGPGKLETATFAGGCFWCTEASFEKIEGVTAAVSGYTGGTEKDPTYRQVASGQTSHLESVQVTFDPEVIGYKELLDGFWRMFDPTDAGGSFVDRGHQYTSAIFTHSEEQKRLAEASRDALAASGRFEDPIVTPIRAAERFYPAEDYHQDFYKTSPTRYYSYRSGSGRDTFTQKHWGDDEKAGEKYPKPSAAELKEKLTPLQYKVTQQEGTEPPFRNPYWDNKRAGIYVDIVSGEPLFSSTDKFKSGTGWPSFTRPLVAENVAEKTDYKMILPRTELRSKHADSHLGHVFEDGPEPTGLRYCINSASVRFVPKESLKAEGYGEYLKLFK